MSSKKIKLIRKHKTTLKSRLTAVKTLYDSIEGTLRVSSEILDKDALKHPTLTGLTQLAGNVVKTIRIELFKGPDVVATINNSYMNSRYTHLTNSQVLQGEIKKIKKVVAKHRAAMRKAPNEKRLIDSRIRWFMSSIYLITLTDTFWPVHLNCYHRLRLEEKEIVTLYTEEFQADLRNGYQKMFDAHKAYAFIYAHKDSKHYRSARSAKKKAEKALKELLDPSLSPIYPKDHFKMVLSLQREFKHKGIQFYKTCRVIWKTNKKLGFRLKQKSYKYLGALDGLSISTDIWGQGHMSMYPRDYCGEARADGKPCRFLSHKGWTCHHHLKFRKDNIKRFEPLY